MNSSVSSNYNGRQPNNTAYIKNFVNGVPSMLWKTIPYIKNTGGSPVGTITTASPNYKNVYIQGDLFVDGQITNVSDINLKQNILKIDQETTEKIMNLNSSSFTFKNDPTNKLHYGFIAQELETELPTLIQNKPDIQYSNIKSVNYLEIIPLLVSKIQIMQKEINELKDKLNNV